ncbi:hypothetical protein ETH_00001305 [Eimeria tenella]|uniref:Uncharacterized protein n=1 Tax=Eimeria tenella TaxID=5802 RepID=U6KVA4_EIMTE|nr:hypothetical protein ETH_00001305 [Eimeria tenella]CDJ41901.1 hypothetical protein ETH_00001305 [Eimeria tenella]|eukprot:XP_013232651.1 hypothetical protein ETH_00001305 [Eimeria tenella]
MQGLCHALNPVGAPGAPGAPSTPGAPGAPSTLGAPGAPGPVGAPRAPSSGGALKGKTPEAPPWAHWLRGPHGGPPTATPVLHAWRGLPWRPGWVCSLPFAAAAATRRQQRQQRQQQQQLEQLLHADQPARPASLEAAKKITQKQRPSPFRSRGLPPQGGPRDLGSPGAPGGPPDKGGLQGPEGRPWGGPWGAPRVTAGGLLASQAAAAARQNSTDEYFWQSVANRTVELRDELTAAEAALLLQTLSRSPCCCSSEQFAALLAAVMPRLQVLADSFTSVSAAAPAN